MSDLRPADSWLGHARATVWLGLPLIGAQLAQTALNVTNTLVLGRLGPDELAASVLGWQLFFVVWMFGSGFGFAVMPLVANALGAGDRSGVGRFVRMGLWVCLGYALVMMVPLSQAEAIFLTLGQDPRLARLAADYVAVLQWSLFAQLTLIVLRCFLGALGRPVIAVVAMVGGVIVNAALNPLLVRGGLGLPALGMAGAGLATVISTAAVALGMVLYCARQRDLRPMTVFRGFRRPDAGALREVFRLGWPIGATVVAEVTLFSATSILMGWIGPHELAAHGIALQLSGLTFMIPLGLSAAATIRVGWLYGRDDRRGVVRAATTALVMGIGIACLTALTFLTVPEGLVALYLDLDDPSSAAVLPFAVTFLAVAAAFQIVDAIQALSSGALRGLKDARVPMLIALFSYWAIGLPVGWWLAFRAGVGGIGIWWGLAIGLTVAALLMTARMVRQARRVGREIGTKAGAQAPPAAGRRAADSRTGIDL